jgi:hypothetical protein
VIGLEFSDLHWVWRRDVGVSPKQVGLQAKHKIRAVAFGFVPGMVQDQVLAALAPVGIGQVAVPDVVEGVASGAG